MSELKTLNDWADYWFYKIGVNVIPADTKNKRPDEKWKSWQDKAIPDKVHESKKKGGYYDKGIAIIPGMIWRGVHTGKYLVGIDLDNKKAVEEFIVNNNSSILERFREKTLVEENSNPDKMHIYFIIDREIPSKASDNFSPVDDNEKPRIEVKCNGRGLMCCSNSPHHKGGNYRITGTIEPELFTGNDIEGMIKDICKKYEIVYGDYYGNNSNNNNNNNNDGNNYGYGYDGNKNTTRRNYNRLSPELRMIVNQREIPPNIQYRIYEGARHPTMLSFANSLLIKYGGGGGKEIDELKKLFYQVNQQLCSPSPLPQNEMDSIWHDAMEFSFRELLKMKSIIDNEIPLTAEQLEEKYNSQPPPGAVLSVSQAIRVNNNKITVTVKGTMTGVSDVYKTVYKKSIHCKKCDIDNFVIKKYPSHMIVDGSEQAMQSLRCQICHEYDHIDVDSFIKYYKNVAIVELQDIDSFNNNNSNMDRLSAILYDKDTENIGIGELVTIDGDILLNPNETRTSFKLFPWLYCRKIEYVNRESVNLTPDDIKEIESFIQKHNSENNDGKEIIIDELVKLFDHSIVGYEHVKKGLLMVAVSTTKNMEFIRNRISALLIGDPGLAKTKLGKRVTQLVSNSRYESGQSSTGKSLTAIIEKTEDNAFLRPGPVPLAGGAICTINELGRQSMEDQGHLLDVMEEGQFSKNALGKHVRIKAPTSIVATANPVHGSRWRDSDKVDLNEFPILDALFDRFDLIFIFRDRYDDDEIDKFANQLAEIEDKIDSGELPDYTEFLIKYIQHAKSIENPTITQEASMMLTNFYKEIKKKGKNFGTPRLLKKLRKTVKAIARLKLKNIADENDARETMEFFNAMLVNFKKSVTVSQSPKDVAYQECLSILKENKEYAYTLEELVETVCKKNEQLSVYFGYDRNQSLKVESNFKVRKLRDLLLNRSDIKKIQDSPITLKWFQSDQSDQSDVSDTTSDTTSDSSDPSVSINLTGDPRHKSLDMKKDSIHGIVVMTIDKIMTTVLEQMIMFGLLGLEALGVIFVCNRIGNSKNKNKKGIELK